MVKGGRNAPLARALARAATELAAPSHPAIAGLSASVGRTKSSLASYDSNLTTPPKFLVTELGKASPKGTEEPVEPALNGADVGLRRSNFEDWMINLRGEEWLSSAREQAWFTGKRPEVGVCPGVSADGYLRALPLYDTSKVTRQSALEYFDNSWTMMEVLFAGLRGEEPFYRPPVHGLRHPQIFYYGHTPVVYVNKLRVAGVLDGPVNQYFESVFEVGVDEMLWDDMHKNDMVWPTVAEVHTYRQQVYKVLTDLIRTHPSLEDHGGTKPVSVTWDHPMWALFMGIEHEKIHLETSSVLFREMPISLVQVPDGWSALHPSARRALQDTKPQEGVHFPKNEMIPVCGRKVELGKPRDFPSYGWDNEYGSRIVEVPDFQASKHMITNGEFWQFVAAGGYRTQKYWSDDGWGWRKYRNMKWPFFWEQNGPQGSMRFKLRTIFEVIDMQWDWPVDVNYHEAKAYCAWKSEQDGLQGKPEAYRVICEAEHHLIRDKSVQMDRARNAVEGDRTMWAGGDRIAVPEPGAANSNLAYGSQCPVNFLPPSSSGHHDAMGNAWEWTEDHFNPLEGFKVHQYYDDFSSPCFDGKHHMIMGGSFVSAGDNGASIFCRYHFRPHFLQHSGFRLVSSADKAPAKLLREVEEPSTGSAGSASGSEGGYESKELLAQYLGLHFPASGVAAGLKPLLPHPGSPDNALRFPQRVGRLLLDALNSRPNAAPLSSCRALDLGCAVGGTSFELAAGGVGEVVGLDFSESFIAAAQAMQRGEALRFSVPLEGELEQEVTVSHEPNVDQAARNRVKFDTGDACRLLHRKAELGQFDGAVLANLLCRLPEPLACLNGLDALIKPNGVLVILTPFSWLEKFTEKAKWLGGFVDPATGAAVSSKERLRAELEQRGFEKTGEEQVPLMIREHQRKYQYIVSEATMWRRKQ